MSVYAKAFGEALRPDPTLTVSQWADQYRVLPSKGAAEPGRYRTDRAPYLREIMDSLSPSSPVQRVVFMKSSQIGGTELGLNWLGCIVHLYPAPVMIVQPTLDLAERFSKQRVAPMIEQTPVLRDLIAPPRERDSGNSLLMKEFKGGVLVIAGSNSGVSLRQMPVRFLFCDEPSGYEPDADGEGDPISLAEKRTQTFGVRKKIFLNSTPKLKDQCRIEHEYLRSDQRRYFVPCPFCGGMQHLKWRPTEEERLAGKEYGIVWEDGDPKSVKYKCEHCSELIPEHHKTKMLAAGEWTTTGPISETRGYHINGLYSPLGWKSWLECVQEFIEAKEKARTGDPTLLKAFVNSVLAETWEDGISSRIGAEGLQARAEMYDPAVVPRKAVLLTAGVDVQGDRLECTVFAWGEDEECWVQNHAVIYGDPEQPEVWKQLTDIILREWRHESGAGTLRIAATAIDSGDQTHQVYIYARSMRKHRVFAIKGQSQAGKPAIGQPTKQDINYKGQKLKWGVDLYPLGVDTIKQTLYLRYKNVAPGPRYIHFHAGLSPEYFEQLVSEKRMPRRTRTGVVIIDWYKPAGKRNEALDCFVYGYAALQFLYTKHHRLTFWKQMERKLYATGAPVVAPPAEAPKDTLPPEIPPPTDDTALKNQLAARKLALHRRPRGFVGSW